MSQVKSSYSPTHPGPRVLTGTTLGQNLGHRLYVQLLCTISGGTVFLAPAASQLLLAPCSTYPPIDINTTVKISLTIVSTSVETPLLVRNALVDLGLDLTAICKGFLQCIGVPTLALTSPSQLEVIDVSVLEFSTITHYAFIFLMYNKYLF